MTSRSRETRGTCHLRVPGHNAELVLSMHELEARWRDRAGRMSRTLFVYTAFDDALPERLESLYRGHRVDVTIRYDDVAGPAIRMLRTEYTGWSVFPDEDGTMVIEVRFEDRSVDPAAEAP